MDPIRNPYAPGAGTPPPQLAGRDDLRENVRVALARIKLGRPSKSLLMVGLRGVGKTVLLESMREEAQAVGIRALSVEAPENRSLPALLAPQLRQALLQLSNNERAKKLAHRALRGLAGFAAALKVKYQDIEVGLDLEPEPGLADNGDLEMDLQALLEAAGLAAKEAETALALFVDELQYVEEEELAALIISLHLTAQRRLPVVMVGAGLPQLGPALEGRSHTPRGCSTFQRSERSQPRRRERPSPDRPRMKAWPSTMTPCNESSRRLTATRTSFRSGGSTPGMWRRGRRSGSPMSSARRSPLARPWTRASSGCGSTA